MALYNVEAVRWLGSHVGSLRGKRVLEFGNQHVTEGARAVHGIAQEVARDWMLGTLGAARYASIDLNGEDGAVPLDLGRPLSDDRFLGACDLVTNIGTSEHLAAGDAEQWQCFANAARCAAPGGLVLHLIPPPGWWEDHGGVWYREGIGGALAECADCELVREEMLPCPESSGHTLLAVLLRRRGSGDVGNRVPLVFARRLCRRDCRESLQEIGLVYGTDKADPRHSFDGSSYLNVYESYFEPLRKRNLCLLEIGVKDAASLKTWRDYFPNAQVWGIDIDPDCKRFEEPRMHVKVGRQDDPEMLGRLIENYGPFDIVIDDGSHVIRHFLASFEHLFPAVVPGGFYVLEDLNCSYQALDDLGVRQTWPGMGHSDPDENLNNDRADFDDWIKARLDHLDHRRGDVRALHFWAKMCVVVKRGDG